MICTRFSQVLPPESGKLPSPAVILDDETGTHQERFGDLADRSGRQPQQARQDVQATRTLPEETQVMLLRRTKPEVIKVLQGTRLMEVVE